jgi:hypothetical protein
MTATYVQPRINGKMMHSAGIIHGDWFSIDETLLHILVPWPSEPLFAMETFFYII